MEQPYCEKTAMKYNQPSCSQTASRHQRRRAVPSLVILVNLIFALALQPLINPVRAQGNRSDLAEQYMQRTAELIQRAAAVVDESESQRARRMLVEAVHLHERSFELLAKGQPLAAVKISRQARTAATQAARFGREALGFEQRARMHLEHYRRAHDEILERAQNQGNERALRFVREAEKQAVRAREQYGQNNFAMALNLIESADALLNRAARLLFEVGGPERLQQEIDRTADMILQAESRLGAEPDQVASEMLNRADVALARARELVVQDQLAMALREVRLARNFLRQATGRIADKPEAAVVQAQIDRWDERQPAIVEAVIDSESQQARRVYEQALQHRARAGESLASGEVETALRQIKVALDLLLEAGDLAR